jgi:hypothetical protein
MKVAATSIQLSDFCLCLFGFFFLESQHAMRRPFLAMPLNLPPPRPRRHPRCRPRLSPLPLELVSHWVCTISARHVTTIQ